MLGGNKKSIGYDSKIVSPPAGLSQYAKDWESWIIANGGTIPEATLLIFDNYFFKPAAANGNILNQLDRLNIYCGLNGYQIAANTNLIKNAHLVTAVNSPTFNNNGYASGTTAYLNLNYIPSTQGIKQTLNSVNSGFVTKNPNYTPPLRSKGVVGTIGPRTIQYLNLGGNRQAQANAASATLLASTPSGFVFLAVIRTNATTQIIDLNGSQVSSVIASVSMPDLNAYELTINDQGIPSTQTDVNFHYASWDGGSSLDYSAFRTILNNLFIALGV